jgi:NADPH-dependent 2,4-dienoyl-CoA reductase/sulfur reductase-like enzyme
VEAVRLSDGRRVKAEAVIIGIGSQPNTEWLDGSGLVVDNGVRCGADLLALGGDDIAAVGDVAHWFNPMYSRSMPVEHWSNAVEQGFVAVRKLLNGTKTEYTTITYV